MRTPDQKDVNTGNPNINPELKNMSGKIGSAVVKTAAVILGAITIACFGSDLMNNDD